MSLHCLSLSCFALCWKALNAETRRGLTVERSFLTLPGFTDLGPQREEEQNTRPDQSTTFVPALMDDFLRKANEAIA